MPTVIDYLAALGIVLGSSCGNAVPKLRLHALKRREEKVVYLRVHQSYHLQTASAIPNQFSLHEHPSVALACTVTCQFPLACAEPASMVPSVTGYCCCE